MHELQLQVSLRCGQQQGLHVLACEIRAPVAQAAHRLVGEATRHDVAETSQVAADVQSQAMAGDPAAGTDADGGHLAVVAPHTGVPRQTLPRQAQCSQYIQHNGLQLAQVPVQVRLVTTQIQDRVQHHLARAMVGDIAATVNAVEGVGESSEAVAHVGQGAVAAKGVAAGMLTDEHRCVAARLLEQQVLMTLLQRKKLRIGHEAELQQIRRHLVS